MTDEEAKAASPHAVFEDAGVAFDPSAQHLDLSKEEKRPQMIRIYLDWLRDLHAESQNKARKTGEANGYTGYDFGYDQGYTDALAEAMKHLEEPAQ